MLRRLRGRFGLSAPRVTVRAHIPWYWRALVTLFLVAVSLVMATWVYDIGRRFAGYDTSVMEQELAGLRDRVKTLEAEAESLRGVGSASVASLQIELTAQQKLGEQVKRLETENGRLREDLAAFEKLASGEANNETIDIYRLQIEPDVANAGSYRYRFLLAAPVARQEREFKGRLQLHATILMEGKNVIVNIPDSAPPEAPKLQVSFKYFRRVEGSFTLPANAIFKKLEVRLLQGDTLVAMQQASLSK